MLAIYKFYGVLFVLMIVSSCTYVYYPSYPVVPDTKGKGFGIQGTAGFTKAQFSTWYALDSNWYFAATYIGAKSLLEDGDSLTNNRFGSRSLLGGVGYKFPLNNNNEFDVQVGSGVSSGFFNTHAFSPNSTNTIYGDIINTMSTRFYIQPSFKIDRGKGGFYMMPRLTYESFKSVKPKYDNELYQKHDFLNGEFFIMGRFTTKALNIDLYAGVAANLYSTIKDENRDFVIVQPLVLGLGLSRTFHY
jgi:hypothetical protein